MSKSLAKAKDLEICRWLIPAGEEWSGGHGGEEEDEEGTARESVKG